MLRKLDISGNATDISIINALRSVLEAKTSLRTLAISNLHKINQKSQNIVIGSFVKNRGLRHLDLKNTTESFYYALREKVTERDSNDDSYPQLKISFTKFVQERGSSSKKEDDNEENINTNNFHERVNDYSARVRLFNKERVKSVKKIQPQEPKTKLELYKIKPAKQNSAVEEESEISELTDE